MVEKGTWSRSRVTGARCVRAVTDRSTATRAPTGGLGGCRDGRTRHSCDDTDQPHRRSCSPPGRASRSVPGRHSWFAEGAGHSTLVTGRGSGGWRAA